MRRPCLRRPQSSGQALGLQVLWRPKALKCIDSTCFELFGALGKVQTPKSKASMAFPGDVRSPYRNTADPGEVGLAQLSLSHEQLLNPLGVIYTDV